MDHLIHWVAGKGITHFCIFEKVCPAFSKNSIQLRLQDIFLVNVALQILPDSFKKYKSDYATSKKKMIKTPLQVTSVLSQFTHLLHLCVL